MLLEIWAHLGVLKFDMEQQELVGFQECQIETLLGLFNLRDFLEFFPQYARGKFLLSSSLKICTCNAPL